MVVILFKRKVVGYFTRISEAEFKSVEGKDSTENYRILVSDNTKKGTKQPASTCSIKCFEIKS